MPFIAGKLNKSVFDKPLTDEASYWIGFLLADGCVSVSHGYSRDYTRLILGLKASDGGHVEKFARFVGTSATVKPIVAKTNFGDFPQVVLSFWAQGLDVVLAEYGVVPRKTRINQHAHEDLKMSPNFWRGVIDGDGSVSIIKNGNCYYPAIMVGGVRALMDDFADVVLNVTGFRPKVGRCRSIFKVGTNGRRAKSLIAWLYKDAIVALERKRLVAERCLEWMPKF